ncbi:MAG TPA: hemerythrin domain-containing protein [bacterium]|nr:hemerythrin domain-containing protein [bacterium]
MDIYTYLKTDHQKVAKLLDEVEQTTERAAKTRTDLFAKIKRELTLHAKAEEKTFYAALKNNEKASDLLPEAYAEHTLIEQLLQELDNEDCTTEAWTGKFKVLKENIEHHVEEEEGEIFSKARKALTNQQAAELANLMEAEKERLQGSGILSR